MVVTTTAGAAAPRRRVPPRALAITAIRSVMPLATVVMVVLFAASTQAFLTPDNLIAIVAQNSAVIVITVVFAMLVMAGYVDLSVGSLMGLTGVVAGLVFHSAGVVPGILAALGVGLGWGLMNGVLIGVLGLSPIIVTLGGLAAARGIALALSPTALYGFPPFVVGLGSGRFLGVHHISWVALLVAAAGTVVLARTPLGKHILAIGVNPRASFLVGIRVKRVVLLLYTATGLAVALGALLLVARLDSAPSGTLGVGLELTVLTAVLLGGVPFTGGRGSMWRVLLGVLFLAMLRNGLTLMNAGTELTNIISGIVLVVAAGLEVLQGYLRKRL